MFDDTKSEAVNRGRTVNKMTKRKRTKGQTMFYKPLYRILKIVQQETPKKTRVNSGVPEGLAAPAPLVIPSVFMLNDMNNMCYGNRVLSRNKTIN